MLILGIHCGFSIHTHEPGAALSFNGKIIACCEEERYLRNKTALGMLPNNSIKKVLKISKKRFKEIDLIVSTGITKKNYKKILQKYFKNFSGSCPKIMIIDHHLAHISSSFFSSGLKESACLSLDAFGDRKSGLIAEASLKKGIKAIKYLKKDLSLGNLYSACTEFLGYSDGDEYKVMGLASYGKPTVNFSKIIKFDKKLWQINKKYFEEQNTPFEHRYSKKFENDFSKYKRLSNEKITVKHKDFSASIQKMISLGMKKAFLHTKKLSKFKKNICLSGGVALNCSGVMDMFYSNIFEKIYISPNPSDRGLALGCAYYGSFKKKQKIKAIDSPYLGSNYSDKEILKELINNNMKFFSPSDYIDYTARLLSKGKIIGWFQGKAEIGARALGNRSILADPRKKIMKEILNKKIKYREEFRPFAPAVLEEDSPDYFFTKNQKIPFMNCTVVAKKEKQSKIPAVVHIDNTSRVQTVSKKMNKKFYELITSFKKKTGIPVLINTSFNLKGQAIVETPRDAIMTFCGSGMDFLVIGKYIVVKNEIN